MNLPIVIFAVLSLQWIDEDEMLPVVGDFVEAHGYHQLRSWAEFLACYVIVSGNPT